jgi:hypothetical protein
LPHTDRTRIEDVSEEGAEKNIWTYIEVEGGWRRLHNLFASPDIIRAIISWRMLWVGHVARMGDMRNSYINSIGKPERERTLRRPRHRWEDNIRLHLKYIGWKVVDWIYLTQDRDQWRVLVNTALRLQVQ